MHLQFCQLAGMYVHITNIMYVHCVW